MHDCAKTATPITTRFCKQVLPGSKKLPSVIDSRPTIGGATVTVKESKLNLPHWISSLWYPKALSEVTPFLAGWSFQQHRAVPHFHNLNHEVCRLQDLDAQTPKRAIWAIALDGVAKVLLHHCCVSLVRIVRTKALIGQALLQSPSTTPPGGSITPLCTVRNAETFL